MFALNRLTGGVASCPSSGDRHSSRKAKQWLVRDHLTGTTSRLGHSFLSNQRRSSQSARQCFQASRYDRYGLATALRNHAEDRCLMMSDAPDTTEPFDYATAFSRTIGWI